MRAGANFKIPALVPFFREKLDEAMWKVLDISAATWATEVSSRIPVWTGQARGTFIPVQRLLSASKHVSVSLDIFAGPHAKPSKNPTTGAAYGHVQKYKAGQEYIFDFRSTLNYMIQNEFTDKGGNPPGVQRIRPWKILEEVRPIVQAKIKLALQEELGFFLRTLFVSANISGGK